jgi:uncharacterized protein
MAYLEQSINILQAIMPELLANYPIKRLAIFGSVSRKEDTDISDIDILVELEKPIGMRFIHLSYALERILKRKVDLVSFDAIKEKYFKEIQPDLILI